MVMELLGPSIEDIFSFCNYKFSLKTVLLLIDQCIKRVSYIHSFGYLHRDIKPDNFVMGRKMCSNIVYIIDLGLTKRYVDKDNHHIKYSEDKCLVGTARFASINNHLGREQSRRDDMESLAYMFIYLAKGSLPWQGLKASSKKNKYEQILKKKLMITPEELCSGLPPEFCQFLVLCRQLKFEEEPNYLEMRKLFWKIAKREGINYDGMFDWISLKTNN